MNRGQFGSSEELPIRMNMDPREQPLVQECSEFVPENRDFFPRKDIPSKGKQQLSLQAHHQTL